jgi:HEAT repeat protein
MVFGLFSKERSLQRAMDKVVNKYAQHADRMAAMEKLRAAGSIEAMAALMRRFSFNYDKTIEDEQEKQWVYEALCGLGEDAIAPLRAFMKDAESVAYPLRVLERVTGPEQALALIDELLAGEPPGYTRNPQKRIQIIDWLADYTDAGDDAIVARVAPYVHDHDENVKFSAIEAIGLHPDDAGAEPLVARLLHAEEESKRLKLRIAEILAEHGMDIGEHKHEIAALCEELLDDYEVKHEKLVRK